jgi:site-specific DNA recombinase
MTARIPPSPDMSQGAGTAPFLSVGSDSTADVGSPAKTAIIYLRVSTARQATKDGEAEGYSIPAQRTACIKKARDLDAVVVEEYVDAGASARSADRDGLQRMLLRLADTSLPSIDYVIVHKLDRLARDRADDVAILLDIRKAGATLVSVSEQIDETPAGTLMPRHCGVFRRVLFKELIHRSQERPRRKGPPWRHTWRRADWLFEYDPAYRRHRG